MLLESKLLEYMALLLKLIICKHKKTADAVKKYPEKSDNLIQVKA